MGEVDYPLGTFGKKGHGLLHIVQKRMSEGLTIDEAADTAVKVGITVAIGKETGKHGNRHFIDHEGVRAIVAINPTDQRLIITGFELDADEEAADKRRAKSLRTLPNVSSEEVVAALKRAIERATPDSIPQTAAAVNPGAAAAPRFSISPAAVASIRGRTDADGKTVRLYDIEKTVGEIPGLMAAIDARPALGRLRVFFDEELPDGEPGFLDAARGLIVVNPKGTDAEQAARIEAELAHAAANIDAGGETITREDQIIIQAGARSAQLAQERYAVVNRDIPKMNGEELVTLAIAAQVAMRRHEEGVSARNPDAPFPARFIRPLKCPMTTSRI